MHRIVQMHGNDDEVLLSISNVLLQYSIARRVFVLPRRERSTNNDVHPAAAATRKRTLEAPQHLVVVVYHLHDNLTVRCGEVLGIPGGRLQHRSRVRRVHGTTMDCRDTTMRIRILQQ